MKFGSLATAATEQADVVGRYLGKLADPDTRAHLPRSIPPSRTTAPSSTSPTA